MLAQYCSRSIIVAFQLAAISALSLWLSAPANATSNQNVSVMCVPFAQASETLTSTDLQELQRRAGLGQSVDLVNSSANGRHPCNAVLANEQLDGSKGVPAAYLLALKKALAFRSVRAWPIEGADLNATSADVAFDSRPTTHAAYYLVMLFDNKRRTDAMGRYSLGCLGLEYYRVNLTSGQVLPYNGCNEGVGIRQLPRLTQLPPK